MKTKSFCWILCFLLLVLFTAKAESKSLFVSWNPNSESDLAGYRIFYSTTSYGNLGSAASFTVNKETTCACIEIPDATYNLANAFYVALTAFDTSDNESSFSTIVFILKGNVVGRSDVTTARVDSADLDFIRQHFGESVTRSSLPTCGQTFIIQPETDLQIADTNRDGRIDGKDQIEVGLRYLNATR